MSYYHVMTLGKLPSVHIRACYQQYNLTPAKWLLEIHLQYTPWVSFCAHSVAEFVSFTSAQLGLSVPNLGQFFNPEFLRL